MNHIKQLWLLLSGALLCLCSTMAFSQAINQVEFTQKLVAAALERTQHTVIYNGTYYKIDYPNGDVPAHFGVCTDVLIRAYRQLGIDLQVDVHQAMRRHFKQFPKLWGLSKPDRNIDHRRVPNLQTLFKLQGEELAITQKAKDYKPGDLVTWMVGGNRPHIGIVSDQKVAGTQRYKIVHNIGWGPRLEDMLFDFPITGHYRYYGSHQPQK